MFRSKGSLAIVMNSLNRLQKTVFFDELLDPLAV